MVTVPFPDSDIPVSTLREGRLQFIQVALVMQGLLFGTLAIFYFARKSRREIKTKISLQAANFD